MDIAAGICAGQRAQSRVVTVALESMSFILPVRVGDILGLYTEVVKLGQPRCSFMLRHGCAGTILGCVKGG